MTRSPLKATKKKRRKVSPAVTQRDRLALARLNRFVNRIEDENRELRRKLGIPDDPYEL